MAAPVFLIQVHQFVPLLLEAYPSCSRFKGSGLEIGGFLMRIKFLLAFVVGPLLVSAASAQGLGGPARLLWLDSVQAELKLTADQVGPAKKISQDIQNKYAPEFAKLQESA